MALELPLFPLDVVLFPGTELPLHIFEPRYRLMVNECYEESRPFGIVLARPESTFLHEEPFSIGTIAEIEMLDRLNDGCMNLVARGGQRFRILSQHRLKPYLSGVVEIYSDIAESRGELNAIARQARALFQSYLEALLKVIGKGELEVILPGDAVELSYFIAHLIDVQDEQKQRLLELTSTCQRLREEVAVLRREVPFMREVLTMSERFEAHEPDHSILN